MALAIGAEGANWLASSPPASPRSPNLPWIYYQPLWTVLSVALAVLIIHALAAYGGHRFGERIERGQR
jgi:hypothetical protein